MKSYYYDAGHMTRTAAIPVYGKKNLLIFSSLEPVDQFHRTWYVESGTTTYHYLLKLLPWVDLDLFFGKVKFYIEKCDYDGFFQNNCSL